VPVDDVKQFEDELLDFLQRSHAGIYASIRESGLLDDGTAAALKDAIEEFRRGFEISGGERLIVEEEPAEPMDEEDIDREKVTRYVPPPAPQG
jgi:F-type H+-transporting ATPase subunit alpha